MDDPQAFSRFTMFSIFFEELPPGNSFHGLGSPESRPQENITSKVSNGVLGDYMVKGQKENPWGLQVLVYFFPLPVP